MTENFWKIIKISERLRRRMKLSDVASAMATFLSYDTIRYDTRCYFNVRSKADMSQLNLPHGKSTAREMDGP